VNIVVGPNGVGKTNLLEAILMVSKGKSYRASDSDLIQFGAEWAKLSAHTNQGDERILTIKDEQPTKKTYQINEKPYLRLPHEQQLAVVLFEPNHLFLLHGAPEGRRAYLDDILEQSVRGYAGLRKNYQRVLAQRNALLKHPSAHKQDFFPWDLRLSELGAVLHRERAGLIKQLNEKITQLYKELSHTNTNITIVHNSVFPVAEYESKLLKALQDNKQRDIERGFTTFGPHREDMTVMFGNNPAALTASRGEVRTIVLALKIIETQQQAEVGVPTTLLLDDVFSELDSARRQALTNHLDCHQTIITTTDADILANHPIASKTTHLT
jgi:DNA replication and repair protein RecF